MVIKTVRNSSLVFLIVSLFLPGCTSVSSSDPQLDGIYKLYDIESSGNSDFDKIAELKGGMAEGDIFSLFRDKTFTRISGKHYLRGRWKLGLNDTQISLTPDDKNLEKFSMTFLPESDENNQRDYIYLEEGEMIFKYLKVSVSLDSPGDDPFHKENNLWRERAAQMEDSAQLRKRLANYVKHLALNLKASDTRKEDVVSIEHSLGPVQIYRSGIGIIPFSDVADSWKKTFFNEEQSLVAYNFYREALSSGRYSGVASESWAIDDYNILLSIYSRINK